MLDGRVEGVLRASAATSSRPRRTRGDRRGAAAVPADRARRRPSSTARTWSGGEHAPDPPVPRADRARRPRRARAVRHRRGLDERGARVARAASRRPRSTLLSEVAIVVRLADRVLGRPRRRAVAAVGATTTTASATRSSGSIPGFEDFNARVRRPAGSRCRTRRATSARFATAVRHGRAHRRTASRRSRWAPGGCCCRPCAPTTSTTRPSTASTTATAASRRAGESCCSTPTTSPRSG